MAKGAFKTQLEVLEKVHPDQVQFSSSLLTALSSVS